MSDPVRLDAGSEEHFLRRPEKQLKQRVSKKIDATIGDNNPDALAYYEAVGFRTYRTPDGKVCKCFEVS